MAALMTIDYLAERAKRGSRKRFEAVLSKVRDVKPEEFDQLPSKRLERTARKHGHSVTKR
jgi:hypothetical protein